MLEILKTYGIDISVKTLYGWESGHRQPDADTFLILCYIYGIDSIAEILGAEKGQENFTLDELKIIEGYRSLNEQGKEVVRQHMELMMESSRYKKSCDLPNVGKEA